MYSGDRVENTVDAVKIGLLKGPDWRFGDDYMSQHHPAVFRSFAATQYPIFSVQTVLRRFTRQKVLSLDHRR